MYNYRIEIEYDGGRYDGWQRLGKDASTNTIESRLCEIIARMTGETVDMYVGSRTEKGVHALCQTANFKLEKEVKAVKLEGGASVCPQIKAITAASIPVMAHIGLTPQSVNVFGGFKVQGKSEEGAKKLIEEAKAVEEAGAFAIVLECVPAKLAEIISESINIPTIGIGAGSGCDGQILVYQDMLGMVSDFTPKFVKQFAKVGDVMKEAFAAYIEETKQGSFPAPEHTFKISEDVINKLY